jgi:arginase
MKKLCILGVPMDYGTNRRGVDMGPSAIRITRVGARLEALGFQVRDWGNIEVGVRESIEAPGLVTNKARFAEEIARILKNLSAEIQTVLQNGERPIVLGGDHSIAMGTVAGLAEHYHNQGKKIGIVWMDAHADINTPETTISGNVHGMPVAHIMGFGSETLLQISKLRPMVDPANIALVGLRDLDEGEKLTIRSKGVHAFTMRDIDELGMKEVMRRAIEIATNGTHGFHVSFDMDWVDPSTAPGVGTPVPGGASYREAHLAMEMAFDTGKVLSMEVTEVNPILDHSNRTAQLAAEVILSAFGKKII